MKRDTVNTDAARKRVEIGLSPRRETAHTTILRPPPVRAAPDTDLAQPEANSAPYSAPYGWFVVLLIALLALATFLLAAARLVDSPTDLSRFNQEVNNRMSGFTTSTDALRQRVQNWRATLPLAPTEAAAIERAPLLVEEFTSAPAVLADSIEPGKWTAQTLPSAGLYRVQVEQNRAVWGRLGSQSLRQYWVESSVKIAAKFPNGQAGLVVRFQNASNFYLFTIDGQLRYRVLLFRQGRMSILQDWTVSNALNSAGVNNLLRVEDHAQPGADDAKLRFLVNGNLLFTVQPTELAAGDVGIWAAANAQGPAVVDYEDLRLSPLVQR